MANYCSSFELTLTPDTVLKTDVVSLVNQLWSLPPTKRYMPCPNPSSLERRDLTTISCGAYVVAPKTDGIRLFLLFGAMESTGKTYSVFINRAYDLFPVKFAVRHSELYEGTLLDGELTQEVNGDYLYTVFDAVAVEGYDLKSFPFSQRKDGYEGALKALRAPKGLKVLPKLWSPLTNAVSVYQEKESISDGLILQPLEGKLKAGIQPDVFKWKPWHRQTIDFYLTQSHGRVLMECGHDAQIINAADINCHFDMEAGGTSVLLDEQRKVYECGFSRFADGKLFFIIIKPRQDKTYANDARIVIATLKAIQDNVQVEELCSLE